jgi:hypothetical protein
LLTGRPPFVEETQIAVAMKHLREPPPALRSIRATIPRSVEQIVMKALEKDPDDRYASAEEMSQALQAFAPESAHTSVLRAPGRGRPSTPPRSGRRASNEPSFSLWPVVLLIVAGIGLAVLMAQFIQDGSGDGSPRDRNGGDGGTSATLPVVDIEDFDPATGDGEHPELTELAADDKPGTEWHTSTYDDPLSLLGKPGVGLIFDLGESVSVASVEVLTSTPGFAFELRASGQRSESHDGYDVIESIEAAEGSQQIEVDGEEARYWLLWITELPGGGGGSAAVSEVRFRGA